MIIVDTALQKREESGDPIKVALIGAGTMGRQIALQFLNTIVGIRLVAVSNRTIAKAEQAFRQAGIASITRVENVHDLEDAIARNQCAVTSDAMLLCQAENVDVIVDATGQLEFGAHVAMEAISHGKHLVLMNAELDATIGPILKVHADRQGVVYTYTDGDEPGVAMNLYRFVESVGYKPVLMGQIKGFLDRYRNPETQAEFAREHEQTPAMVASFADGSKLSLESILMANATGFTVGKPGMYGYRCDHVKDLLDRFSVDQLLERGLVDYVLGAEPHSGAFVVGYNDHPDMAVSMKYFKMGDGPLYMFYTPFHLPHLQLPHTVARAALFQDPTLAPKGAPVCDTGSFAKRNLKVGEVLDGMGGFACYGLIDSVEKVQNGHLLPIVLSEGCRLKRDIAKDESITYADVDLPDGRLCDKLRDEQTLYFQNTSADHKRAAYERQALR